MNAFVQDCSISDMVIRLTISALLGFILGCEREFTNKWAGLRTHILVTLGSTLFTILSIYSFPKIAVTGASMAVGDPARVAAQILTGIGFIGGGTVLRHGASVYGLTTAATLWMAASIGMAVGTGDYILASIATLLSVFILVSIRKFQEVFIRPNKKSYAIIKATVLVKEDLAKEVEAKMLKSLQHISGLKRRKYEPDDDYKKITVQFEVYDKDPLKKAYKKFDKIENIESVSIEQDFNE